MNETYDVAVFHEVFSDHSRMDSVRENMLTRLRAAGLDPESAVCCVNFHPDRGVFVMVVTAIPPDNPHIVSG